MPRPLALALFGRHSGTRRQARHLVLRRDGTDGDPKTIAFVALAGRGPGLGIALGGSSRALRACAPSTWPGGRVGGLHLKVARQTTGPCPHPPPCGRARVDRCKRRARPGSAVRRRATARRRRSGGCARTTAAAFSVSALDDLARVHAGLRGCRGTAPRGDQAVLGVDESTARPRAPAAAGAARGSP